ncbi:hypothetical protein BZG36_01758 [Bifiguratus adelaidae]|uniref:Enoyl reductase (ER) domain-containing protein n=1 Tax=Bifiguratus adelaidae TaxID=1938954 RepID=A0A261Y2Y1_9FUNG|nr:hypothetical protein BZG36_01758 [Bifiguratus adelaidae]
MKVALLEQPGDETAFKIKIKDIPIPTPGKDQVVIRLEYSGINYIDTTMRAGKLPGTSFPIVLGCEGAGAVHKVGEGVTDLAVGDPVVVYAFGTYGEYLLTDSWRVFKLDKTSTKIAAATLINACTAQFLVHEVFQIKEGGIVIGTVSSQDKIQVAQAFVAELTNGQGAEAVFDAVGGPLLDVNLSLIKPGGVLVNYGSLGGPLDVDEAKVTAQQVGKDFKRVGLGVTITNRELMLPIYKPVKDYMDSGKAVVNIYREYSLEEIGQAHLDLVSRGTTGKLLVRLAGTG